MADIIRFDTGIKEFSLNEAVTVRFCPTDVDFAEKVFSVADTIDAKYEEFKDRVDKLEDNRKVFEEARIMDNEIRDQLNSIFDMDICTPLFGSMRTYSVADGLPVWANLILALIDTLDADMAEQKKRANPRLKKYIAKYKRR